MENAVLITQKWVSESYPSLMSPGWTQGYNVRGGNLCPAPPWGQYVLTHAGMLRKNFLKKILKIISLLQNLFFGRIFVEIKPKAIRFLLQWDI